MFPAVPPVGSAASTTVGYPELGVCWAFEALPPNCFPLTENLLHAKTWNLI